MAKRVQLIRHTSGAADLFVGLEGEITVDLTNDELRVHDGVTAGGVAQARKDLANTQAATNSNAGKMTAAHVVLLEALDALTVVHETRLDTIEANILEAGTVAMFMQAAAPTGWTIDATHNNKALRISSTAGAGSGGTESFTTIFNSGTTKATNSHALTSAQIPAHTHPDTFAIANDGAHTHGPNSGVSFVVTGGGAYNLVAGTNFGTSATTDSPGNHNHSITGSVSANTGGGGGHTHTLTMNLQYVDLIACTKDAF